jgi:hypothetical protein
MTAIITIADDEIIIAPLADDEALPEPDHDAARQAAEDALCEAGLSSWARRMRMKRQRF